MELQQFLQRFGYLEHSGTGATRAMATKSRKHALPAAQEGVFDDATVTALTRYQVFHHLPVTGMLDVATSAHMSLPRCGFRDSPTGMAAFTAQGNRWTTTRLTYRFENFSPDLSQAEIRAAISAALNLWSQVTPLTFVEVTGTTADIRIRFVAGDHGDGSPFDGVGHVLAHAFYPPPNGGDIAGDAHFDEAETWSVNIPATGFDLMSVAAHEFGHSLGLDHSSIAGALMEAVYTGPHRFLHADDIAGIQSIYGRRRVEQGNLLHLAGVTTEGRLWHTIRYLDGAWNSFGDVEAQTGDRGFITDMDLQSIGNEVHVCAVSSDGHLWHTIRRADGTWYPFGDVEAQTGDRGSFRTVSATSVASELHVCGTTADGRLWHTLRRANGSWYPFGDIEGQSGDRGSLTDVDCANVGGEVHVCAVNSDGQLWHSVRRTNGTWTPFGDVEGQAGDRGALRRVACAGSGSELHVCAVNSNGQLWHSMRRADGTWTPFGDVEAQTGNAGTFVQVSVGEAGGELHVSGTTTDGRLWHAIRRGNGTWTPFGDVEGQAGDRGRFVNVSVDGLYIP
ncbi:matrixin family metalloprotease [Corallococcus exercitus]